MTGPWIEATTIGDLLLRAAERSPHTDAVVFPEQRATYAELVEGAWRVARGLHGVGVRPGEHVGILMPNCMAMVEALFGVALLGAVICPINARYRSAELRHVIENADLAVLLTSDIVEEHVDYVPLLHGALPGLADCDPGHVRIEAAPKLHNVVLLGRREAAGMMGREQFGALADSVPKAVVEPLRAAVRVRDPALILYTSGTTANPKGCVLTHEAIVRGSRATGLREQIGSDDVVWDPLPLFHTSGLQPLLYTLDVGARFLCMTHFEPGAALAQIKANDVTLLKSTFPPVTMALVNHEEFSALDISRIRVVQIVAPPDTLRLVQAAFPRAAIQGAYGLCEAGGYIAVNEPEEQLESRLHTEGRPFPGIEIRAVDLDGVDMPPGEPGELLVRGYTLFEQYYRDPVNTAEVLDRDGWLHTGDRGAVDADGRVTFLGRIKEMIRVGGENVSPAEIEGFLSTHPAVHLVQAVGIPDERLEEVPAAFVELKPGAVATEQELIDHCRGQIASFKVPRYIRFVEQWPMSATKIQRFRLRDRLLAELGLD